jgi:hypothetical protein
MGFSYFAIKSGYETFLMAVILIFIRIKLFCVFVLAQDVKLGTLRHYSKFEASLFAQQAQKHQRHRHVEY